MKKYDSPYVLYVRSASVPQKFAVNGFLNHEIGRLAGIYDGASRSRRGVILQKAIGHSFDEIGDFWDKPVFFPNETSIRSTPETMSLTYHQISCRKVNGMKSGQLSACIMLDPADPIHSELFKFNLVFDTYNRRVIVVLDNGNMSKENAYGNFLHVLEICRSELYRDGACVMFNTRKIIRRAKQRYLFWLKSQGELPGELKPFYDGFESQRKKQGNRLGRMDNAEHNWTSLLGRERRLQNI